MLMQMLRGRRFMEKNPMAASVPNTVEINAARTATLSVVIKASMMASLWSKSAYQCKVKPVQTARFLDSLNEKMISTKMGAYKNT